ncbi:MAG: hypothetical protein AB7I42_25000 [Bradyrhizobium sp.]|uniref:hypothetical protein n=1 Tax=Bradyrhizobium sp. TaxID=376 RepID=UPI003D0C0DF3
MRALPINRISLAECSLISSLGFAALYFVGFADDVAGAPIKVGIAGNCLHSRLHAIQTGNWRTLVLRDALFVQCGDGRVHLRMLRNAVTSDMRRYQKEADEQPAYVSIVQVERDVHADLTAKGLRVRGEWFSGGLGPLVEAARAVIGAGTECYDARTMLRRVKLMRIEAGLA